MLFQASPQSTGDVALSIRREDGILQVKSAIPGGGESQSLDREKQDVTPGTLRAQGLELGEQIRSCDTKDKNTYRKSFLETLEAQESDRD